MRSVHLVRRSVAVAALFGAAALFQPSLAPVSLAGSSFEIDTDANLRVDATQDWAGLAHASLSDPEKRAIDLATGTNDNSYKGGVKEDTECPGEVTGSIPNNKSDLRTFHLYEEPGVGGHPGFLNLAWSRVTDPSGTTLMDFEFNKGDLTDPADKCATGPNVQRSVGDLLIEYAITQGGAKAAVTKREWTGTVWGPTQDLTTPSAACGGNPCADGTINTSVIPAAQSDGILTSGQLNARTFGEAQIDLRTVFESDSCVSFGTAMLKSRSSDSFTSQLKDFIAPIPIDLQNCGKVIIRKETDPDGATVDFGYTKAFDTDPGTANTFQLSDGERQEFEGVLFGDGYTVTEDDLPAGWDFDNIDCSASSGVDPDISGATITFDIDNENDVLDCTYTNKARAALTIVKETPDGFGTFDFTSSTVGNFSLTTTSAGDTDSTSFDNLTPGAYDVAETEPAGFNLDSATCDNGDDPSAITLEAGDNVTCTFVNVTERGAILITKTRKHAADGPGDHPHAGVTFTITDANDAVVGSGVTNASGQICVDGLPFGDYTVTEDVPDGYVSDDAVKGVTVSVESECGDGNEATVEFANTPLTNITVSVDSQVDGGTASTIDCDSVTPGVDASTGANGDGSHTMSDLEPGTYTCVVVVDP